MKFLLQRLGLSRSTTETPDAFDLRLARTLARERSASDHGMLFRTKLSPQEA